jgi:hypothetical protein
MSANKQYLTGIEELDKEILLSSDLSTLIQLYETTKSLRKLIDKIFPEWVKINNSKKKFLKVVIIGAELLENDHESLLEQLIGIYKHPDPSYIRNKLYAQLAQYATNNKHFDLLNKVFKIGASKGYDFKEYVGYLYDILLEGGYLKLIIGGHKNPKIKPLFYKIAVVAKNNGLYNIVDHILEVFPDLQINQDITMTDLDKEILLFNKLSTLMNLYNKNKFLRDTITKLFPDWLKIHNPNGSFPKMLDIGFELLIKHNETLLKQLIKIYSQHPDLDYKYYDLYTELAIQAIYEGRYDLLDEIFKIGKASNYNFKLAQLKEFIAISLERGAS